MVYFCIFAREILRKFLEMLAISNIIGSVCVRSTLRIDNKEVYCTQFHHISCLVLTEYSFILVWLIIKKHIKRAKMQNKNDIFEYGLVQYLILTFWKLIISFQIRLVLGAAGQNMLSRPFMILVFLYSLRAWWFFGFKLSFPNINGDLLFIYK